MGGRFPPITLTHETMAAGVKASTGHGSRWAGGRIIAPSGYAMLFMPEHPRASSTGYVREHIVVVERALGHALRVTAEVHHFDEVRSNNANTNLVACNDRSYHNLLHRRMRALLACGDPNAACCRICGKYDHQEDIVIIKAKTFVAYHQACHRAAQRARRHRYQVRTLDAESLAASVAGALSVTNTIN